MLNEAQEHAAYSVHLRAEHHRLHEVIQRINQDWPVNDATEQSPDEFAQTAEEIVQLREELAHHFRKEEEGGCLEEAVCRCPSLGHDADRIEAEHEPFLVELDEIISCLQAARESTAQAAELRHKFEAFAQKLHVHEEAENQLLENAFGIPID